MSASGAKTAALVYDPLGRLFQTSGGSAGITRFLYDDDALIAEYNCCRNDGSTATSTAPTRAPTTRSSGTSNLASGWRRGRRGGDAARGGFAEQGASEGIQSPPFDERKGRAG